MKRIYAIEKWCIDCKRCEVACKAFHSKSGDPVKSYLLERDDLRSRVHVEGTKDLSIAVNCRHCEDPKCVEGCISGAMQKDPVTGMVFSDPEKCVGCRTCVSMCPYGCVSIETVENRSIALKCDFCAESLGEPGVPRCVATCPNNALIYVNSEGC